jgi:hypothetical protein
MRATRWVGLWSVVALSFSSLTVQAQEKIETFFPKDTDMIMSFNVEQILSSDLMKKYALKQIKDVLNNNDQIKTILTTLGLDPLTDFKRIYISGALDFTEQKSFIIIEGKFDAKKINSTAEDFLKSNGDLQVEKIGGKTAYKFTPPNAPQSMFGMVADNKYLLLGSDKEYLEGGIAAIGGKGKSVLPKEMVALLSKTDPKASMFMVANTKDKLGKLPIPMGNTQVLESIEFFAAELKVEKEVRLNLAMGVADEETAAQMSMQIKQGLQLAKAFLPQMIPQGDPRLKPVTDLVGGIKTTQKGKVITLSAEASDSLIDALLKADK